MNKYVKNEKYVGNRKKYVKNMKKYEKIWEKYEEISMWNRASPSSLNFLKICR